MSAIILINDTRGMQSFSHESKCPNQFFHHSQQPTCDVSKSENTWNPWGSGLLLENFDIPIIFLSTKEEWEKVVKCYRDFNLLKEGQQKRALCSIEINSFMAAASNSEVCIRRSKFSGVIRQIRFCDPLQGRNIYATLFPREIVNPSNRSNDKSEKIILVSARLDTTSMFDGVGLGAMDSLASVATLVSTAHFLRKVLTNEVYEKNKLNVLFILFNGESYDYIGSQRFVYDLKKKNAFPAPSSYTKPLTFENIEMMIDLGALDTLDNFTIYHLPESSTKAFKFQESINSYNDIFKLSVTINLMETKNIPPVSAQMFLRENTSFPALIIATNEPKNKFYHSIYDDANNLKYTYKNSTKDFDQLDTIGEASNFTQTSVQVKIRNIATAIGLGIYDMLETKKYSQNMVASSALVDEFLYCFLISTKCRLFQASFDLHDDHRSIAPPPQRYISVNSPQSLETTGWSYRVLGFILSEKSVKEKENCTTLPYYWLPGSSKTGECRYTTQNFSSAISPAFEEDENYNFKSNLYSTWTESTWNDLSARMFLKPSSSHETFIFIIGFIFLISSFVVVSLVKSKAEILFGEVVNAEQYVLIN